MTKFGELFENNFLTGAMLAIVLLAPLFVPKYGMLTVSTFVLCYSLIVVPSVTKFYSPFKVLVRVVKYFGKLSLLQWLVLLPILSL